MKIMICGPSGIGKTTLSDFISNKFNIEYISGSISDLIPDTKKIKHQDMLSRPSETLLKEDYQLINLRNKRFKDLTSFITDRSYVDSAAYFLYKQSTKIPSCEVEQFISLCKMLLNQQCDILIFLNLLPEDVNKWVIENNKKRILNTYYQVQMSSIMADILEYMGMQVEYSTSSIRTSWFGSTLELDKPVCVGDISSHNGITKVLIIPDLNKEHRLKVIEHFLNKYSNV